MKALDLEDRDATLLVGFCRAEIARFEIRGNKVMSGMLSRILSQLEAPPPRPGSEKDEFDWNEPDVA